jgi:hypothetical protein
MKWTRGAWLIVYRDLKINAGGMVSAHTTLTVVAIIQKGIRGSARNLCRTVGFQGLGL